LVLFRGSSGDPPQDCEVLDAGRVDGGDEPGEDLCRGVDVGHGPVAVGREWDGEVH